MTSLPATVEYGSSPVDRFLAATAARLTADGMPWPEIGLARAEVSHWDRWWSHWMGRAETLDRLAGEAATRSTRYELGFSASLCAHLAQYLHFGNLEEKHTALRHKIGLYQKALEAAPHVSHRLEVPYRSASVPALLHVPADHAGAPACVIYVGGLDAHKEDAHQFVSLCLARGMAVACLDGPGQGEAMLREIGFESDAHEAISSLIDQLEQRDDVDPGRIGLVGRSLGGYLAPRVAADDPRVGALVVWAAMWDLEVLGGFPAHTRAGFVYITGSRDLSEAAQRLEFVDLSPHAGRIESPTLIVHGENDRLTPVDHARRLASAIGDPADLRIVPGSEHCNHDVAHLIRPAMSDWLATRLSG